MNQVGLCDRSMQRDHQADQDYPKRIQVCQPGRFWPGDGGSIELVGLAL